MGDVFEMKGTPSTTLKAHRERDSQGFVHATKLGGNGKLGVMYPTYTQLPYSFQLTSADGFFNRKRGRPPKNRYVQVYKSLQLPPQAVFTSFKLEQSGARDAKPDESLPRRPAGLPVLQIRSENLALANGVNAQEGFEELTNKNHQILIDKQRSVVRARGTFYPHQMHEHAFHTEFETITETPSRARRPLFAPCEKEMPEDLRVRRSPSPQQAASSLKSQGDEIHQQNQKHWTKETEDISNSYIHLMNFINFCQQTLQRNNFLTDNIKMEPTSTQGQQIIPTPPPHPDFSKFRLNEDCGYPRCSYRQRHQTHFHCCRNDCEYSFCDKARLIQHSARHKRLDILLGSDFKQYADLTSCGFANCLPKAKTSQFKRSPSHFHCLKCSFACSETNKIASHRRWHRKLEFLNESEFRHLSRYENYRATSKE